MPTGTSRSCRCRRCARCTTSTTAPASAGRCAAHYDGTVAFLASGSLSHRFAQNGLAPEYAFKIWSPFLQALDHEVVEIWKRGDWKTFCGMLPEYAAKGHGEGFMHDTAMLLG